MKKFLKFILVLIISILSILLIIISCYSLAASLRETKMADSIAPATGRFIKAGDLQLYIQELGDPKNPPVLMIHGMGSWSELWRETMIALSENGFYAIAADLPPFGFSQRPDPTQLKSVDQAMRLIDLIENLGLKKVHLLGHSFGGGATLHTALLIPDQIISLNLVDVAVSIEKSDDSVQAESSLLDSFFEMQWIRDRIFESTVTNPHLTKTLFSLFVYDSKCITDEKVKVIQSPMRIEGTTHYLGDWLGIFISNADDQLYQDFIENRNKLLMPIHFIWGEEDTVTPLSRAEFLQKEFPGSSLDIMNGIGHIPQLESPEVFNQILISLLKESK
jgi:pimeloyl-ACP methyl ester carboxylesterase